MAAGAVASANIPQHDVRWKWLLLIFCAIAFVALGDNASNNFGFGSRPWHGWWDTNFAGTEKPYVISITQPQAGGAAAKAGLRDGDLIDLRDQTLNSRLAPLFQPMATQPNPILIHRGNGTFYARVVGSTIFEGAPLIKVPLVVLADIGAAWFLGCALIIALRRSSSYESRVVAMVLLLLVVGWTVGPGSSGLVVPNPILGLLLFLGSAVCTTAAYLLLVLLSSRFGVRYAWRRLLEWFAYATNVLSIFPIAMACVGILTLGVDPIPYLSGFGFVVNVGGWYALFWSTLGWVSAVAVALVAIAAVACSPLRERPRAAWLLLPLPVAFVAESFIFELESLTTSWFVSSGLEVLAALLWLIAALTVTYALLKRRVLDFGFVISRTVVVATVSLIVVAAFVLLEWLLGTTLSGVGHLTGIVANGILALVLGVSLRYIHKRVDASVDAVLFRKRHNDERALRDFSKEAAYITESDDLLDLALAKVRCHTDARSAAIWLGRSGSYTPARSFGDGVLPSVGENDSAILALKTWHNPLDPHHYTSAMQGALALPMISRGRLLGILLLGERVGGEAYAPDEVDALSEFAHGTGSALDALSSDGSASIDSLRDSIASLSEAMALLPRAIAAELRNSIEEKRSP